jgi:hypothetical protein
MEYLEPLSPCCLDLLYTKIRTKLIICNNCNKEFQLMENKK